MSNIIKGGFVAPSEVENRVINSNKRVDEMLRELAMANAPKQEGEFTEGLFTETVEEVVLPSPEEVLEEARMEAEQIVSDAKAQAEQMQAEAQYAVDKLYEEHKAKGYADGQAQLMQEFEEKSNRLEDELAQRRATLESEYDTQFQNMERDLVNVILEVLSKVMQVELENSSEIVLHLLKKTLNGIDADRNFRIRVSGMNKEYLKERKEELFGILGSDVTIDIVSDANLTDKDCIIESDSGVFDCGVGTEYKNLVKMIRYMSEQ